MCAINMVCAWPVCAFYVHATCMMCACPACAWCVPGVCLVCAWHAQALFFLTPPPPPGPHTCHAHTTTHATATCRCCRAITAVAACPSTIRGMRHTHRCQCCRHTHRCRRRCHTPHVPPPCTRPRQSPLLPHEPPRRSAAAATACAARCRRCCRCAAAAANVNIQSWLTSAASNYVNQNVNIAKRFHCFLARFKISAMGEWNIIRRKSTVKCDVKRFRCF